jgi:hypothetical protein
MGALPKLRIKDEFCYRKGSTNESENCRYCIHFHADAEQSDEKAPGRCAVIGLKSSARYRVRSDHKCSVHTFDGTDFQKK